MQYSFWIRSLTFVSLISAIFSSLCAYYLLYSNWNHKFTVFFSGMFIGLGILLMHYIGLSAMQETVGIRFDSYPFVLSVIVAVGFSYLSVKVFMKYKDTPNSYSINTILSAVILGLAIFVMHDLGMRTIVVAPHVHDEKTVGIGPRDLGMIISIFVIIILSATLFFAMLDYRRNVAEKKFLKQIMESEERYRRLVEHSPEPIIVHDGEEILFINKVGLELMGVQDRLPSLKYNLHRKYLRINNVTIWRRNLVLIGLYPLT